MKLQDKKVNDLLQLIIEANQYIECHEREEIYEHNLFLFEDISNAVRAINRILYSADSLSVSTVDELAEAVFMKSEKIEAYLEEFMNWKTVIADTLLKRSNCKTDVDVAFYTMTDYISYTGYDKLLHSAIEDLKKLQAENREEVRTYEEYYTFYRKYWGGLLIEKEYYKVLENRISMLKEHLSEFIWLYEELADYRSKMVLSGILRNWLSFDITLLSNIKEANYSDYFDLDLITCSEKEVFVDLGAYTGDSTLSFIHTFGEYKQIYCYEITPESIDKMKESLKEYPNIEIRNKGASSEEKVLYLNRIGKTGAANQIKTQGELPISAVRLDEDIKEKITFLKMDIEGAEQQALLGCKRHIAEERPKLAVCTYHNNEDIWKIPQLIKEMCPDYKLYMRYYGSQIGPADYVLYAI